MAEACYKCLTEHFVCSAERGWKLGTPDGSLFNVGEPGAAADVALQLLLPELSGKERSAALSRAFREEQRVESAKKKEKVSSRTGRGEHTVESTRKQEKALSRALREEQRVDTTKKRKKVQ